MATIIPYSAFLSRRINTLAGQIQQDMSAFSSSMGDLGSHMRSIEGHLLDTMACFAQARQGLDAALDFHGEAQSCFRPDGSVDERAYAALLDRHGYTSSSLPLARMAEDR
ncbi:hypothetical protein [Oleisolibacter albus]|uniref:hypothetical protein n=1 Tax=Oleisolibacter albus TaxID=2171757 RepID=UPI000DF19AAC|nr:hypothetical protein [Oleisolibacter albus]